MSSKSSAKKSKPVPGDVRRAAGVGETAGSGSTPTSGDRRPIVGRCASAAVGAFIGAMPAKTGLSFVVGEHFDRTHEHLMPQLLARSRTPEVHRVPDRRGVRGSPDHSYRSLIDH